MKGRHTAAMLCVLLGHALLMLALLKVTRPDEEPREAAAAFISTLFFFDDEEEPETEVESETVPELDAPSAPSLPASADAAPDVGQAAAITPDSPRGYIDWPVKGKESVARVLAAEAEAERVAKMFSGPQGTWASLTKRQRDELNHFRWAPGVDGLERDENGNTIYRLKNGCVLVSFVFIGCPIGKKPPAYGDLFKDMRLYFDQQRLPRTNEGNGTEPESKRPPKWSKPLE
jgi:hypothetical protein